MLRKLLKTYQPELMAGVFESIGPTLREQEFKEYTTHRVETPPDLIEQIPYVRKVLPDASVRMDNRYLVRNGKLVPQPRSSGVNG